MQELSGGTPAGDEAPRRIEAGPGGYDRDHDTKPWQRGPPTSDVAPWQQRGRDEGRPRNDYGSRDHSGGPPPWASQNNNHGSQSSNYTGAPGAAAPWHQQQLPPPPGGSAAYGYGGYPGYQHAASNMQGSNMGVNPPPPPGMGSVFYGGAGSPPPPPPGEGPPPPVSDFDILPQDAITNLKPSLRAINHLHLHQHD